ncbi:tRNA (adenosine(37)-N6)-threonylcarbamoyltransferase complex transferase subunit TsaD [Helicobacter salomonis]|uniref:tRNA (adenosine(37)-N6)-threonylcarbamoyltransferase complex transferase subunit TsaD n=1 Tax=Helicobacter salomonis TaxID=56878 RepID=UPI000CF04C8E|nr:tRNA (adenosine(37)-N6)-threonylcarbamoyltransferase complex transferase subunit TsaD [Helicobacter salomonis]
MLLSIESSCDDSSLALTRLEDAKLLWHAKISQEKEHSAHGGVVPELASRLHAHNLPLLLQKAKEFLTKENQDPFKLLKAIALTTRPGLAITLLEGLMMAKALALSLKLPLISVDHLKGHVYSLFINQATPRFPLSVLLVSGGHTLIVEAHGPTEMCIIAKSLDDSLGESFDKVARMLGLGYPGGPVVERLARLCPVGEEYPFPLPLKQKSTLAFSFSGLKNAVRLAISNEQPLSQEKQARICAGFQKIACAHLLHKVRFYLQHTQVTRFGLVGGVSANAYIRTQLEALCTEFGAELLLAPLEFCTDNAAMIGRAGVVNYHNKIFADLQTLDISPQTEILENS